MRHFIEFQTLLMEFWNYFQTFVLQPLKQIVATCACCTLNLGLSLCQIAIAIAAAKNDNVGSRGDIQMKRVDPGYLNYDIYYARNNPNKYLCSGPNSPFTWVKYGMDLSLIRVV